MLFVAHRINTIEELLDVPLNCGVEIDLRETIHGDCVLQHDPFKDGVYFEEWLKYYKHSMLICNIKSEGIEMYVRDMLKKHDIEQYFFLDSSIPMINKLMKIGETRIAVRYSEIEPIEFVEKFVGKCEWLWVDCFSKYPCIDNEICKKFKICLVGPTLQGHKSDIFAYDNMNVHAVCDKMYNYSKNRLKGLL